MGLKLCWLLNERGQVVAWDVDTMNVHDQRFHLLLEPFEGQTIVLADSGFGAKDGLPRHLKRCAKGSWNERMVVETALSMVTATVGSPASGEGMVCDLKRLRHRVWDHLKAHLAFVAVMFNVLLTLFHTLHPTADPFQMSIAEFSL